MQGVAGWEGGVNQGKELLANPTLHIEGEGWVEPGLWLSSIFPSGWYEIYHYYYYVSIVLDLRQ